MTNELESLVGQEVIGHIRVERRLLYQEYICFKNGRILVLESESDEPAFYEVTIETMKEQLQQALQDATDKEKGDIQQILLLYEKEATTGKTNRQENKYSR